MRMMNASDFKAHCLALLDEIAEHGEEITILKRGRPVARLVPVPPQTCPQLSLRGTVRILGDIISSPEQEWEAENA